jgi:energy-coupling factor transporter ATP-binding protein EcfA2
MTVTTDTTTDLVLVGFTGAGKTTLGQALAGITTARVLEFGHVARADAATHGADPLLHANARFAAGDYAYVAERVLSGLKPGHRIFVGPRRREEIARLRRRAGPCLVVALDAPETVRNLRKTKNPAAQALRDEVEASWGLERTMAEADLVLSSTRSIGELVAAVRHVWLPEATSSEASATEAGRV